MERVSMKKAVTAVVLCVAMVFGLMWMQPASVSAATSSRYGSVKIVKTSSSFSGRSATFTCDLDTSNVVRNNTSMPTVINPKTGNILQVCLYVSIDGGKSYKLSGTRRLVCHRCMPVNLDLDFSYSIPSSVKKGTKVYYYFTSSIYDAAGSTSAVKSGVKYRTL